MVDLPIPQQRLVTTERAPSVSPRERAAAGALIGNGLTNFGGDWKMSRSNSPRWKARKRPRMAPRSA